MKNKFIILIFLVHSSLYSEQWKANFDENWLEAFFMPVIELQISGNNFKFLVDTGSEFSYLWDSSKIKSNIQVLNEESLLENLIRVKINSVSIENKPFDEIEVYTRKNLNSEFFSLWHGVLGMDFLQKYTTIFNYIENTILFSKDLKVLDRDGYKYTLYQNCPLLYIPELDLNFLLDTGAGLDGITYFINARIENNPERISYLKKNLSLVEKNDSSFFEIFCAQQFKIADHIIDYYPIKSIYLKNNLPSSKAPFYYINGLIGNHFFKNTKLIIQGPEKTFYIERGDKYNILDSIPLELLFGYVYSSKGLEIIFEKSPFYKFNLLPNDKITDFNQIKNLFIDYKNNLSKIFEFRVERNEKTVNLTAEIDLKWWINDER